jgi:hypothetical protein
VNDVLPKTKAGRRRGEPAPEMVLPVSEQKPIESRHQRYYAENREKVRERQRRYYIANREAMLERQHK